MNTHNLNLDLDKVRGAGRVVPVSATVSKQSKFLPSA
jgi:hypothetical protein